MEKPIFKLTQKDQVFLQNIQKDLFFFHINDAQINTAYKSYPS